MLNKSHTEESIRDSWRTPPWLFAVLDAEFKFGLDAAASNQNALCKNYFTLEDNALEQDWKQAAQGKAVFCNPPYSRGSKEQFLKKAEKERENGVTSVFVLPAAPSELWFPWKDAQDIRFISGRVNFMHPTEEREVKGASFGTCVVVFDQNSVSIATRISAACRDGLKGFGESIINQKEAA